MHLLPLMSQVLDLEVIPEAEMHFMREMRRGRKFLTWCLRFLTKKVNDIQLAQFFLEK